MGILAKIKNSIRSYNSITLSNDVTFIDRNIRGLDVNAMLGIPAVHSAVELISNTVASLDIKLYYENDSGVEEVKGDKRVYMFNDEPNILMTGADLKKAIVRDYLIYGNCYIYVDEDKLTYIPANEISIFINKIDPLNLQITMQVGGKNYFPHQFIILTKNTKNGVTGFGVLDECQKLLKLAQAQNDFTVETLKNGGIKRGVLKAEDRLRSEELNELKEQFEIMYAGKKNTMVLNKGICYHELQQSSQEMQLIDLKNSISRDILTIFDIPENLFNNNIPTELWQMFIKSTISPILTKIEQALNKSLLTSKEKGKYYFAFDTKQLMKGDITKRFDAYEKAIKNGFMTRNEVRFEEDLKELQGLDTIAISLGEVLMDTKTGEIYTPNTNEVKNIQNLGGSANGN